MKIPIARDSACYTYANRLAKTDSQQQSYGYSAILNSVYYFSVKRDRLRLDNRKLLTLSLICINILFKKQEVTPPNM